MTEQEINRTIAELLGYETPYEQLPQDRAPQWVNDTDQALKLIESLPTHLWARIEHGYSPATKTMCWYCMIETAAHAALGGGKRHSTVAKAICEAWIEYKQTEAAAQP